MKRVLLFAGLIFVLMVSGCDHDFFDDDFYDDDGRGSSRNPVTTTVAGLSRLRDDTNVLLTGTIQKAIAYYGEKFEFVDNAGGRITLDIDYEVWWRNSLDPAALPIQAEIIGELDKEPNGYMEIDVNRIRKL